MSAFFTNINKKKSDTNCCFVGTVFFLLLSLEASAQIKWKLFLKPISIEACSGTAEHKQSTVQYKVPLAN